jgi:hypothetical protein
MIERKHVELRGRVVSDDEGNFFACAALFEPNSNELLDERYNGPHATEADAIEALREYIHKLQSHPDYQLGVVAKDDYGFLRERGEA